MPLYPPLSFKAVHLSVDIKFRYFPLHFHYSYDLQVARMNQYHDNETGPQEGSAFK